MASVRQKSCSCHLYAIAHIVWFVDHGRRRVEPIRRRPHLHRGVRCGVLVLEALPVEERRFHRRGDGLIALHCQHQHNLRHGRPQVRVWLHAQQRDLAHLLDLLLVEPIGPNLWVDELQDLGLLVEPPRLKCSETGMILQINIHMSIS